MLCFHCCAQKLGKVHYAFTGEMKGKTNTTVKSCFQNVWLFVQGSIAQSMVDVTLETSTTSIKSDCGSTYSLLPECTLFPTTPLQHDMQLWYSLLKDSLHAPTDCLEVASLLTVTVYISFNVWSSTTCSQKFLFISFLVKWVPALK